MGWEILFGLFLQTKIFHKTQLIGYWDSSGGPVMKNSSFAVQETLVGGIRIPTCSGELGPRAATTEPKPQHRVHVPRSCVRHKTQHSERGK